MDIKGLDYTVFAFIRTLIGNERQRTWLEFAAGLTLDDKHLAQLRKEMKEDMNCASLLGAYNIILARIAEAESQIKKVLSLETDPADPCPGASSEMDSEMRQDIIAEILRHVILADTQGRGVDRICFEGWQGIEGLQEISREVLAEKGVDLA